MNTVIASIVFITVLKVMKGLFQLCMVIFLNLYKELENDKKRETSNN